MIAGEASSAPASEPVAAVVPRRTRGGLVAVCGVAGGAGASSLAALVAYRAVSLRDRPVLLCDTGGPMASLADYLGQRSPRSLLDAAEALSEERLDGRLFATLSPRLRMVASGPDAGDDYRLTALGADGSGGEGAFDRSGVGELLRQAREAHALTVVDCGSLQREVERDVVRSASHVVWTARGDGIGELRAATTLAHFGGINRGERVLAVRPAGRRERVSTRRWLRIADVAGARLVVVPYLDELARQLDRAPAASAAIDGLVATLR